MYLNKHVSVWHVRLKLTLTLPARTYLFYASRIQSQIRSEHHWLQLKARNYRTNIDQAGAVVPNTLSRTHQYCSHLICSATGCENTRHGSLRRHGLRFLLLDVQPAVLCGWLCRRVKTRTTLPRTSPDKFAVRMELASPDFHSFLSLLCRLAVLPAHSSVVGKEWSE